MKRRACAILVVALLLVAGVILHPLAVGVAASSPLPPDWTDDPAVLALPSSPAYPGVVAYRDLRLAVTDRDSDKASILLRFAGDDAKAINTMAARGEYAYAARHTDSYRETFGDSIYWMSLASDQGYNTSRLLTQTKNSHLRHQGSLDAARQLVPDDQASDIEWTQVWAARLLVRTIQALEGDSAAVEFAAGLVTVYPVMSDSLAHIPQPTEEEESPGEPDKSANEQPESSPDSQVTEPIPPAPSIGSLVADETSVMPGDSTTVTAVVEAHETDELSYSWWCSRGTLVSDGRTAVWTSPERAGYYEIELTVGDSRGRVDTRSIEIEVVDHTLAPPTEEPEMPSDPVPSAAPEIVSLTASADHKYLSQGLTGVALLVSQQAVLHCEIADADGVSFKWTVTGGGRINGSGDTVVLTAPDMRGELVVTVTTTNEQGEQDSKTLNFHVTTCRVCFL